MFGFRKRRGTSSLPVSPLRMFCAFLFVLWLVVLLAVIRLFRSNEGENPLIPPQQQQEKEQEQEKEKEKEEKEQQYHEPQKQQKSGQITLDLRRITDPVNELVADDTFLQLHHGIYRVISPLKDGSGDFIKFAFKTECRPAALWHGQQGWVEIALHSFQQLFYEEEEEKEKKEEETKKRFIYPTAALARGVVVAITEKQVQTVAHRDRCGELSENMLLSLETALGEGNKLLRGGNRTGNGGNSHSNNNNNATVLLIGVALTWEESYDDAAYPSMSVYAPYFTVPPFPVKMRFGKIHRFEIYEMSDVMMFDYLLLNPDRQLKNWFKDKATRRHSILMDNGWAFAGQKYDSSVCEDDSILLSCPSPLQVWIRHKKSIWRCKPHNAPDDDLITVNTTTIIDKKSKPNVLKWCRFRPETLIALNRTRLHWYNEEDEKGAVSKRWLKSLYSDILIRFLLYTYGSRTNRHGFNMALSRYVNDCPLPPPHSQQNPDVMSHYLLQLLEIGLMARMNKLALHAENCLRTYGETYVYGLDIKE